MLDPKYIREHPEEVKEGARKKRVKVDIDLWLKLDERRKTLLSAAEQIKSRQKKLSARIPGLDSEEREKVLEKLSVLKKEFQAAQSELKEVSRRWEELLSEIPNVPSPDMPEGEDENDNLTVKTWGGVPEFDFAPKDHVQLGKELDLIDVAKAAEVSGSRFYYLKGDLVRLQFALTLFGLSVLTDEKIIAQIVEENDLNISTKPFVPLLPPVMIRKDIQKAIHRVFGDQTYAVEGENLNLVASAEHTMAPYHMNETLNEEELPKRYVGYSVAFRREAGTYGKDMGGIFRCHQFDKSEMEVFSTAETGLAEQRLIVALQEYMMQKLELPYRLQLVCTGDTGKPDYLQYDIETWFPGQNKYRETHTSDYMTDYQTRGIKSYYKTSAGERKLLHTNDATVFSGRPLAAIMENFQQADGTIIVPEVLRPFMGGQKTIRKTV